MSRRLRGLVLGLLLAPVLAAANDSTQFGVAIPYFFVDGSAYTQALQKVKQTGNIGWARILVPWKDNEVSSGNFSWLGGYGNLASVIDAVSSQGYKIILTFMTVPTWAQDSNTSAFISAADCPDHGNPNFPYAIPPAATGQYFYRFTFSAYLRFRDKVSAWEIWNEPENCSSWRGSPLDLRERILKPGYNGIHDAAQSAGDLPDHAPLIGGPGLLAVPVSGASLSRNWVSDEADRWITEAGTSPPTLSVPLDFLSIHPYGPVRFVEAIMAQAALYSRSAALSAPLSGFWVTETGYGATSADPSCRHIQSCAPGQDLVEISDYCLNHTSGKCQKIMYWNLYRRGESYGDADQCDLALFAGTDGINGTPKLNNAGNPQDSSSRFDVLKAFTNSGALTARPAKCVDSFDVLDLLQSIPGFLHP